MTDDLIKNGYPRNLVQKTYRQQDRMTETTTQQPSIKVIIPYIQGQSEAIRRVLKYLDIQTCFTPVSTLRQMLSHPKDPIPTMKKSGVVYRIPCADCDKSYVGQTGRNLSLWIKEHKKAVETFNTDTSALAEHVLSKDHHINWEETTVIGRHPFINTRCIVESWFINREKGLMLT